MRRFDSTAGMVGRQVAGALLALLLSSLVIFSALYVAPGNTLKFLAGGRTLSPQAVAALESEYHMNEAFPARYWHWLIDAIHGDFGRSLVSKVPVDSLIGPRIGSTLILMVLAGLITIVGGIGFGVLAGLSRKRTRALTLGFTSVAMAIPSFVAATALISLFAVQLGWFPVFGSGSGFFDEIFHLILPAIALSLGGFAYVSRISAVSIDRSAAGEYVETAKARGFSGSTIVRRHILRNALIPVTTVAGITFAGLFATSAVVETAFGVNGLGALLVQSVLSHDFAVVQAVSLLLVAAFLVVNLTVDLLYDRLDPRLRKGARA